VFFLVEVDVKEVEVDIDVERKKIKQINNFSYLS